MNRADRNLCPLELKAWWGRWTLNKMDKRKSYFVSRRQRKQRKEIGVSRAGESIAISKRLLSRVLARKLIL